MHNIVLGEKLSTGNTFANGNTAEQWIKPHRVEKMNWHNYLRDDESKYRDSTSSSLIRIALGCGGISMDIGVNASLTPLAEGVWFSSDKSTFDGDSDALLILDIGAICSKLYSGDRG